MKTYDQLAERFDSIPGMRVDEETLGAYLEGNLAYDDMLAVSDIIDSDPELSQLVDDTVSDYPFDTDDDPDAGYDSEYADTDIEYIDATTYDDGNDDSSYVDAESDTETDSYSDSYTDNYGESYDDSYDNRDYDNEDYGNNGYDNTSASDDVNDGFGIDNMSSDSYDDFDNAF